LLSVVAQALFLYPFSCAGKDLPPFGNANEGCQWEV
jgi:hypothetical protein